MWRRKKKKSIRAYSSANQLRVFLSTFKGAFTRGRYSCEFLVFFYFNFRTERVLCARLLARSFSFSESGVHRHAACDVLEFRTLMSYSSYIFKCVMSFRIWVFYFALLNFYFKEPKLLNQINVFFAISLEWDALHSKKKRSESKL